MGIGARALHIDKLGIRTIIYVCPEEYRATNRQFCEENNITIHLFSTDGNLEPFVQIDRQMIQRARLHHG